MITSSFEPDENVRKFIDDLMINAPIYARNSSSYKKISSGQKFVTIDMPIDRVYLILSGKAKIIDFMESGIEYAFDELSVLEWVGELEVISNIPNSNATVIAITDCQTIPFPRDVFMKWMYEDVHALMIVCRAITSRLLSQSTRHRRLFFTPAHHRLLRLIIKLGETQKKEFIILRITRAELANLLGCSERTVIRCLRTLRKQAFLSTKRGQIEITQKQFRALCQESARL